MAETDGIEEAAAQLLQTATMTAAQIVEHLARDRQQRLHADADRARDATRRLSATPPPGVGSTGTRTARNDHCPHPPPDVPRPPRRWPVSPTGKPSTPGCCSTGPAPTPSASASARTRHAPPGPAPPGGPRLPRSRSSSPRTRPETSRRPPPVTTSTPSKVVASSVLPAEPGSVAWTPPELTGAGTPRNVETPSPRPSPTCPTGTRSKHGCSSTGPALTPPAPPPTRPPPRPPPRERSSPPPRSDAPPTSADNPCQEAGTVTYSVRRRSSPNSGPH